LARHPGALKSYDKVIYAAVAVRGASDAEIVEGRLDLFFAEHDAPATRKAKDRCAKRQTAITSELFPRAEEEQVLAILRERRFVVLEGPPGTGKTRWLIVSRSGLGQARPSRAPNT
jgi:5-methylcytosine-specific restriction protein B